MILSIHSWAVCQEHPTKWSASNHRGDLHFKLAGLGLTGGDKVETTVTNYKIFTSSAVDPHTYRCQQCI